MSHPNVWQHDRQKPEWTFPSLAGPLPSGGRVLRHTSGTQLVSETMKSAALEAKQTDRRQVGRCAHRPTITISRRCAQLCIGGGTESARTLLETTRIFSHEASSLYSRGLTKTVSVGKPACYLRALSSSFTVLNLLARHPRPCKLLKLRYCTDSIPISHPRFCLKSNE